MIKSINRNVAILVAGAFFIFSLFSIPYSHCSGLDFNATYYGAQGTTETYLPLSSQETLSDISSRSFLTPRVSWVNFFAAKMIENREIFPWDTPTPIEEDRFDQVGGMQYELYEGEFHHIDYIRQDIVKNLIPTTAEELLKTTRTGRKIDRFSKKVASYFTIQYLETYDGSEFKLPGRMVDEKLDDNEDLYGISLSARLFNDVNSSPFEYALELNSFYLSTMARLQYEPADVRFLLTLTDSRFEEILGCRTAFEFVSEPSEIYGMIRIFFAF